MQKHLEKMGENTFEKIFNQKLGMSYFSVFHAVHRLGILMSGDVISKQSDQLNSGAIAVCIRYYCRSNPVIKKDLLAVIIVI